MLSDHGGKGRFWMSVRKNGGWRDHSNPVRSTSVKEVVHPSCYSCEKRLAASVGCIGLNENGCALDHGQGIQAKIAEEFLTVAWTTKTTRLNRVFCRSRVKSALSCGSLRVSSRRKTLMNVTTCDCKRLCLGRPDEPSFFGRRNTRPTIGSLPRLRIPSDFLHNNGLRKPDYMKKARQLHVTYNGNLASLMTTRHR